MKALAPFQRAFQEEKVFFQILVLSALVLAIARYFSLSQSFWPILYGSLFFVGSVVAPFFILLETEWKLWLRQHIKLELDSQIVLRKSFVLLFLPFLGLFLVTSSRAPFGLGVLWGISFLYSWDVVQILRGEAKKALQYFPHHQGYSHYDLAENAVLYGYLLYVCLLAAGVILI